MAQEIPVLQILKTEKHRRHLVIVQPEAVEPAATLDHRPADQADQAAAMVDQEVLLLLTETLQQLVQAKEIMAVRVALVVVAIRALAAAAALVLRVEIVVVVMLAQAVQDQPG